MPSTVISLSLCAGLLGLAVAAEAAEPQPGEVIFETGFETAAERDAWSKADFATWVPGWQQGTSLQVTVPAAKATAQNMIAMPIDLTRFRGCRILMECQAKAENVTRPQETYLGVKFMLHYQSAAGPYWGNESNVNGTFDWKKLSFGCAVADDATGGQLSLGLQNCSGTAWFDALRITVVRGPLPKRPAPMLNPPPAFRGHNLPRLRGVMSPNAFKDEDLRVLGEEWKANVIRWQMTRNWGAVGTDRDLAEYDKWIQAEWDDLDKVLVACRKYGLKVVIDLHSPPGGRLPGSELAIFHDPVYQDHFVKLWEQMAQRYRGNPAVWGYDLVNEPVQNQPSPAGVADYLGAQVRAAKAIRAIDPTTPIFIESNNWDSADGYRELMPVDVPNVIYQVHMYVPGEFTHQGVHGSKTGVVYPGKMGATEWNKDRLRAVLQPVREFQLAYNVHIYVGEFSAIRWATGAAQYLSDVIDLFEEYGWDWTYHAYREWDGWSVEHGPDQNDRQPTKEPTDRKLLLLSWFAKNQKPQ